MTLVLLIVIVILLVALLRRRNPLQGRNRPYFDRTPPQYDYDGPTGGGFGMRGGLGVGGGFITGMAAGALLDYLFEQGRIDEGQYGYYNAMDGQQMMSELMQQNIIQQDEIYDLQQRLDGGNYSYDNFGSDGYDYQGNGDAYSDVNYDDGFSNDGFDDNNNGSDGGWV